jgi:hypothetical protein
MASSPRNVQPYFITPHNHKYLPSRLPRLIIRLIDQPNTPTPITKIDIITSSTQTQVAQLSKYGKLPGIHLRYRARQGTFYLPHLYESLKDTNTKFTGQLFLLLQDRRVPPWRPMLKKTRQTLLFANHPPPKHVPEPSL